MKIFGFMIPFYYLIYFMDFIYVNILIIFLIQFSKIKLILDSRRKIISILFQSITLHLINNNRIPFRKIYADRRRVSLNFHERVGSFDKARVRKARENRVADSLGRRQREKTRRRAKRSSFRDRRCAPRLLKPGLDSKLSPIGSGFLSLRHGKERVEKDGGGEVRESRKK